jgi:hypothetical protein
MPYEQVRIKCDVDERIAMIIEEKASIAWHRDRNPAHPGLSHRRVDLFDGWL